jgi:hypothetical protein
VLAGVMRGMIHVLLTHSYNKGSKYNELDAIPQCQ